MKPLQTSDDDNFSLPDGAFLAPAHLEDTIVLESAIDNIHVVNPKHLSSAWRQLSAVSVEAALAGRPDVFDFANDHCLLFAAIRSPVKVKVPDSLKIKKLGLPLHDKIASHDSPIVLDNPVIFTREFPEARKRKPRRRKRETKDADPPAPTNTTSPEKPPQDSEETPSQEKDPKSPTVMKWKTIGVVYVTMSSIPRQVHIGVSVLRRYRSRGHGMQACALAVQWAFETIDAHRVQARIMSSASRTRESTQRLFTALGFAHEGIQRRAVTDAKGAWEDITYMGIVDMDWIVRNRRRAAPRNLWDELFQRNQRERDELLRWEANEGVPGPRMRRTSSMETVRGEPYAFESDISSCADTDIDTDINTRSSSPAPSTSSASRTHPAWQNHCDLDPNSECGDFPPMSEESETDDLSSDTEWVMGDLDSSCSVVSGELISRPLSAASSSSFESVGTAATSLSGVQSLADG
ncbi:hypothetical protein L226DRAFT_514496 [Lentinus tigrinus ALCF2SS1-7]|uniref:N-acetyltransferase domain-containing protein n=1 Tax=Lentinus tigrinus ALCF2SS1-6 TaxID=1328759 RepID=A0A5C2S3B4_9APHY|nr:hypothetical protein L227DRAFT_655219 [Lentinus tigrinus ALCF2SS1-6]RPD70437.1 hypothetical protein L226DRAFT_514496 [Lentinus tigrinus ALCF2SS1-7]